MAKNEVYKDSQYLSLPVANGVLSGEPVIVGNLVGVAQTDEGDRVTNEEGYASVALTGAFRLSSTVAFASVGLPVYITSARVLNATSTGNRFFGYTLSTKASGAGTVIVKIVQSGPGLGA